MIGTEPPDGRGDAAHVGAHVGRWHREPGGAIAADAGALHLIVQSLTPGGYAHFLVLHRPEGGRCALLASGSEEDVSAAMQAAEREAARVAAVTARTDMRDTAAECLGLNPPDGKPRHDRAST